ncbi:MAG: S8 family serine peptidase [Verrucomicrobiota bacterium]
MHLRGWIAGLVVALGCLLHATAQDARFIRLRNATVTTPPAPDAKSRAAAMAAGKPPVSGLFLLQLDGPISPEQRETLQSRRLDLLHPIPDHAYVCHLEAASAAEIRALPFVRWLGEYQPEWRLDRRLASTLAAEPGTPRSIRMMLRPHTPPGVLLSALRQFTGPVHRTETRFGIFLGGLTSPRRILDLARSPAVLWIEPAGRMKLVDEIATEILMGDDGFPGKPAEVQQLGFDGRGVTVSVADSGLDTGDAETMHRDLQGRVDAFFAYGGLEDASDEHSHGTHCAGIVAGSGAIGTKDDNGYLWGLGVAPGAHLVAQRIFDGAGDYYAPPSYETLTRDAVRSGAYVGSNSWGDDTQGRYDLSAAEFDALVRDADARTPGEQPYILEFSAGNSGPGEQTIGSPAVAKNVIATGACQNDRFDLALYAEGAETMADFSSRGPAEDGRIKPDITAPGTWIASLKSQMASDANAWLGIDENYLFQGGTSQAGPHVSGACAVFVQWYRETQGGLTPSPALVKAALINSAVDMTSAEVPVDTDDEEAGTMLVVGGTPPVPNGDEGWGRSDVAALIAGERRFNFTDQGSGLKTGAISEKRIIVGSDDALKVTLAYTDVPGLPAAIPALVNDLDLEVVSPDGRVFRGNAFLDGESVAGTVEGDRVNNVEGVLISNPSAGEWILRVRAQRVVQDVHGRTNLPPEQDFALVVSGQIPFPGEGVVSWDRETYPAPTVAQLRLVDTDLRNQSTATVTVSSESQTSPLTLTLQRSGIGGTFTGAVSLVTSPKAGSLTVANGNTVTVSYADASPAGIRTRTAVIDLDPPVLDSGQGRPALWPHQPAIPRQRAGEIGGRGEPDQWARLHRDQRLPAHFARAHPAGVDSRPGLPLFRDRHRWCRQRADQRQCRSVLLLHRDPTREGAPAVFPGIDLRAVEPPLPRHRTLDPAPRHPRHRLRGLELRRDQHRAVGGPALGVPGGDLAPRRPRHAARRPGLGAFLLRGRRRRALRGLVRGPQPPVAGRAGLPHQRAPCGRIHRGCRGHGGPGSPRRPHQQRNGPGARLPGISRPGLAA